MNPDKQQETEIKPEQLTITNTAPSCHSRKIPIWLVLLDNVPTLLLFILGGMIINQISAAGAIIFVVYALFSVVWFWAKICPYCHHYDTYACPCGYGAISPRFFKRRDSGSFKKVFKRNLLIVFPNWFVPFGIAVYLLLTAFSEYILILTIVFSLIGFVIIPLISKFVGCKNCEIKDDCPWMNIKNQNRSH
jgi:hypothetical protein